MSLCPGGENNFISAGGDSRRDGISADNIVVADCLNNSNLDQFGRIANQNWVNSSTGTSVDNYTYSYDQNGNVTAKNNVLNSAYSETYSYDLLNRLTAVTRGGAAYQSWNLDSQGNWSSSTTGGVTQTRTANAQNQITSITGTTGTPAYDANGNMTTDQNGNKLVYDAWNRLVSVTNSAGAVIAQYSYDARDYAISVTYPQGANGLPAGTTNYIYYDNQWQVLEVRTGGTAASNVTEQMVWSAAYVNAAVLQDSYYNGVLQANQRLYFLQDANWNTTAVVGFNSTTGTWQVTQRYVYSPYGNITVLNADWSTPPAGTSPIVNNLYQGMSLDPVTGLYYERARWYSPSLGTWISQDPLSYVNGANTYQFVMSGPVGAVDPTGEFWGESWIIGVGSTIATGATTIGSTVADATGLNGSAVAGAFWNGAGQGAQGGASIDANTLSFGLSDKLGLTNSSQYQGGAYNYSRDLANAARMGLIAAGTGGTAALGDLAADGLGYGLWGRAIGAGLGGGLFNAGINALENKQNNCNPMRGWLPAFLSGAVTGGLPYAGKALRLANASNWWNAQGVGMQNFWNNFAAQNPQFVQDAAGQAALWNLGFEAIGETTGHAIDWLAGN